MEGMVPNTIRIQVTKWDVARSETDPTSNPLARAISRKLKASLDDVEMNLNKVYIWNEWDDPEHIYVLDNDGLEYKSDWEEHQECPETFEFNIIQRK